MANQIDYDLNLQATEQRTDIAYQPEQLSNEQLEGVAGGFFHFEDFLAGGY